MAKKLSFNIDFSSEYSFIGIASQLKDYRLAFFLNKQLNLNLKRISDFIQGSTDIEEISYSLFNYHHPETKNNFCLISNHNSEAKLIAALKNIDYFLLIENDIPDASKKELIANIRKIPNVMAAYDIELSKIKNISNLLADLELQLLENK